MSTSTFGTWLRTQRKAHGYSQEQLGAAIGVHRTYITQLERKNSSVWPEPETRAKFHAVFGTSDADLEAAGVAVRKEYPRPGGNPRVVYEPAVSRDEAPAVTQGRAAIPSEIAELLDAISWTPDNVAAVKPLLEHIVRADARAASLPDASPDPSLPTVRQPDRA